MNKPTILLPTLEGDRYFVIPGIALELCHDSGAQIIVNNGLIGEFGKQVRRDTIFKLRLFKAGELDSEVISVMAITLDGDNWASMSEFAGEETTRGLAWETYVPVIHEHGEIFCTRPQSNSLKLILLEKEGFYSEHTIAVITQENRFYLVHQRNYDREQIFTDETGAFLPINRSRGKQPKRLALADLIKAAFAGKKLPSFQGEKFKPAPTGAKLKEGEARVLWWSAHRQIGGAVTHTGEQVRIFWSEIRNDEGEEKNLRYFEPDTAVTYEKIVPSRGQTTYRHDLVGVFQLQPALV